ncbi:unnamed protein product [Arctogadus glacialis]
MKRYRYRSIPKDASGGGTRAAPTDLQRPPPTCSGPRRPAATPADLQRPPPTCSDPRRPAATPADLQRPPPTCSDPRRPAATPADLQRPPPTCSDPRRPAATPADLQRPPPTCSDPHRPAAAQPATVNTTSRLRGLNRQCVHDPPPTLVSVDPPVKGTHNSNPSPRAVVGVCPVSACPIARQPARAKAFGSREPSADAGSAVPPGPERQTPEQGSPPGAWRLALPERPGSENLQNQVCTECSSDLQQCCRPGSSGEQDKRGGAPPRTRCGPQGRIPPLSGSALFPFLSEGHLLYKPAEL